MFSEILRKLYYQACCDELDVFKPGNHSKYSRIPGMSEHKFRYAAKISSNFLANKNLSLGEAIFFSAKECKIRLNSNYNLGIIILCAPIIKTCMSGIKNFKVDLKCQLDAINENDGKLIIKAIQILKPGGIKNYKGKANVLDSDNKVNFDEMMKIGASFDRISKCYIDNYKEIFDFGLPIFKSLKKKTSKYKATQILYINYLANALDSHLNRKVGKEKAEIIMKKGLQLKKQMKIFKDNNSLIKEFDFYLKKFHSNPGTCADLTVTTLLIDKISDIFKLSI